MTTLLKRFPALATKVLYHAPYCSNHHLCRQLVKVAAHQGHLSAAEHQISCLSLPKRFYHNPNSGLSSFLGAAHVGHVPKHCFHTSQRRLVPPVLWFFLKPAAKLGAILTGRGARKWWRTLPRDKRHYFWGRVKQNWFWFVLGGLGLGGAMLVYYKTHLEETPITGRKRFIVVTHNQFQKIAEAEALQTMAQFQDEILPGNHPRVQRVLRIGQRLLEANPEIQKLVKFKKWKVFVIDDPNTQNAFVLPTGHIFVFTGIMDFATNDDQLAVLIAHEMAHALLNHGIETVSYTQLVDFMVIAALAAIWCVMPFDGLAIVTQWFYNKFLQIMLHMPYSRKLEKEADKVGLQLAARACYDVREGSVFWSRMQIYEDVSGSEDSVPEWLSTHPSHQKRTEFLDFFIPKMLEERSQCRCPPLPAKDPRDSVKDMKVFVDNQMAAKKAGQNLSRVKQLVGQQ